MFTCVLGRYAASTVILVPKLSEGADRVGGQLLGDKNKKEKEYPVSGVTNSGRVWRKVTNSGRVWRKVPESDARSVATSVCVICLHRPFLYLKRKKERKRKKKEKKEKKRKKERKEKLCPRLLGVSWSISC